MRVKIRGADDFLDVGQPVDYAKLMTQARKRSVQNAVSPILEVYILFLRPRPPPPPLYYLRPDMGSHQKILRTNIGFGDPSDIEIYRIYHHDTSSIYTYTCIYIFNIYLRFCDISLYRFYHGTPSIYT